MNILTFMYSSPPRSIHSYDREMQPLIEVMRYLRHLIITQGDKVREDTVNGWRDTLVFKERRYLELKREKDALGYYTGFPEPRFDENYRRYGVDA